MAPEPQHPVLRLLRMALGVVVFLAGVVMLFIPGPGLLFMALGLGLVDPRLGNRFKLWLKAKLERKPRGPS